MNSKLDWNIPSLVRCHLSSSTASLILILWLNYLRWNTNTKKKSFIVCSVYLSGGKFRICRSPGRARRRHHHHRKDDDNDNDEVSRSLGKEKHTRSGAARAMRRVRKNSIGKFILGAQSEIFTDVRRCGIFIRWKCVALGSVVSGFFGAGINIRKYVVAKLGWRESVPITSKMSFDFTKIIYFCFSFFIMHPITLFTFNPSNMIRSRFLFFSFWTFRILIALPARRVT